MGEDEKVLLARVEERLHALEARIEQCVLIEGERISRLEEMVRKCVTMEAFWYVRAITVGAAGLVLASVVAAAVGFLIRKGL